jgi:hypothetical protein
MGDRAIGYRRAGDGPIEQADSYEGEAFYGSANLSISASALAQNHRMRPSAQARSPYCNVGVPSPLS